MENKNVMFNGTEGVYINAGEASVLQNTYLDEQTSAGNTDPIRAQFFGRDMLLEMLGREGAMGLRIYQGIDTEDNLSVIIVPTDKYGKNIVADQSGLKDPFTTDYGAYGPGCPMHC